MFVEFVEFCLVDGSGIPHVFEAAPRRACVLDDEVAAGVEHLAVVWGDASVGIVGSYGDGEEEEHGS